MPVTSLHDVPRAGTLWQISYCARCGAVYYDKGSCTPDGREAERRAHGHDQDGLNDRTRRRGG